MLRSIKIAAVLVISIGIYQQALAAGPDTPAAKKNVEVAFTVLPFNVVRDNYGHNVSDKYLALDVAVHNTSGAPERGGGNDQQLLIVKAFVFSSLSKNGDPSLNTDPDLVKGSIEKGQQVGVRNRSVLLLKMLGTLGTSSIVFFKAAAAKSTFSQSADMFNDPFMKGIEGLFPDTTIRYLAKWGDDQVFKEGFLVEPGATKRGRIFLPIQTVCKTLMPSPVKGDPDCREGHGLKRATYDEGRIKQLLGAMQPFGEQLKLTDTEGRLVPRTAIQ